MFHTLVLFLLPIASLYRSPHCPLLQGSYASSSFILLARLEMFQEATKSDAPLPVTLFVSTGTSDSVLGVSHHITNSKSSVS